MTEFAGRARSIGTGALICALAGGAAVHGSKGTGRRAPDPVPRARAEEILGRVPDPVSYGRHLRLLTAEPHRTGTRRNMELAGYVRDRFRQYGLDEVGFHDTPALLSSPVSVSVELVKPVRMKLKMKEDRIPEDADSDLYDDPAQVPYHAYAPSGDVEAEVVYANSGSPEDFAILQELGIEVKGRIVLMRYSSPYSYRGYKVYQAEIHGAAGAIVYSDPEDDGFGKGEVYPDGPWGPPSHIQWGSIIYDWFGPGEPFTFHWRRRADGDWHEGPRRDVQLPKIPSVPMSHEDASQILSRLRGPAVPSAWRGGLPIEYHVGPGPVTVRMRVRNEEKIGTMRNVLGVIHGREEPDLRVVIGNHRDAWVYGAVDPSSGTAALLELARALGEAVKAGHRPRRTIVLANWDGEEDLLGGSTSWVKDNRKMLLNNGVAYVNVDSAASGPRFEGGATPELAGFLREAAKAVPDPGGHETLFEAWGALSEDGQPAVDLIVGATDYTAFMEHLGIGCIDMSFNGPYGVYHSQYDSYAWMSRVGDPGFRYGVTMARLMGVVAWRLAEAEILPFDHLAYAKSIAAHLDTLEKKAREGGGGGGSRRIDLRRARAAAARWEKAALSFDRALEESRSVGVPIPPARVRRMNGILLRVSRAMTEKTGLRGRPFFRHLLFAPQPTYRPEVVPRLFEAIERGDWGVIPRHEQELVAAFDRAADLLAQAALLVRPSSPARAGSPE